VPRVNLASVPTTTGSRYPSPFDGPCRGRQNQQLGDAAGLTQFGVNLTRLPPGTWSSQRHWHRTEDEFVWVLEGEVWMVTDDGEEPMRSGECAGFKAGERNGHHFQNRATRDAVLLTIGTRDPDDSGEYSDIDMMFSARGFSGARYARKNGTAY
jgi:uncharacterized cupin superfamily protein